MKKQYGATRGVAGAGRVLLPALLGAMALGAVLIVARRSAAEAATPLPQPAADMPAETAAPQRIVLAGGCFWGVQAVFQHVKGVTNAVSGYAGGEKGTASYGMVSTGRTGHAESVEVTFDPRAVGLGTILQIYFSVAHDPTELNFQGPDTGTQYRSEIFYESDEQKRIAEAYIAQLDQAKVFSAPIVTRVERLKGFYAAEAHHQNYATLNPDSPYIAVNDMPKIANLSHLYGELYQPRAKLVAAIGSE
jgi:peptide-methionine (S)-S-oxide reductase